MTDSVNAVADSHEARDAIRAARDLIKRDRRQGLAAFNEVFRGGRPPQPPLDGSYDGELLALDIAPGVTQLAESLASVWMPWKGKHLTAEGSKGDNIFGRNSRLPFRILFPFYRGVIDNDADTFRAFEFVTGIESGKEDPGLRVLRIDYDSRDNPGLSIRRIVDEVTQIDEGVYLGKIHFKWWWGTWKMMGYFSLRTKR